MITSFIEGEIKALIQEKVIKTYSSMLCKGTILVLRNVGYSIMVSLYFKHF
jgi:hypothetical protein